jgi:CRP-like cAMP-binding protein
MRRSYSSLVSQSRRRWNANSIVQQAEKRECVSSSFSRTSPTSKSAATDVATTMLHHQPPTQQPFDSIVRSTLFHSIQSNSLIAQARNALPLIGNGAYLAICSGFLMTDMLQLRLLLVGGYTGLVLFHSLHVKPLVIPLRWSFVFVMINAGAAALLVVDQFGASLSEEEELLFETHFQQYLTRGQFWHLLKLSKQESIPDGTVLTTEGQISPHLYFLLEGQAKVYHHKTFAANVDQGGFVNDIAFQRQQQQQQKAKLKPNNNNNNKNNDLDLDPEASLGAYGTVITNGPAKVLVWDTEELQQRLTHRPELNRNLKYLLSRHLMKSLLQQREARHAKTVKTYQEDPAGW